MLGTIVTKEDIIKNKFRYYYYATWIWYNYIPSSLTALIGWKMMLFYFIIVI